ncbi:unnamed protein product [Protopolystoma xenopodis]|uniref:Uncharacterized protein n=1 Tax=Protopolystoma xenopodis TaxID=117903 RepID=A0A3S5AFS9_9PLAT|nr:unnamed protein product [Protopolystoma xenopodis]
MAVTQVDMRCAVVAPTLTIPPLPTETSRQTTYRCPFFIEIHLKAPSTARLPTTGVPPSPDLCMYVLPLAHVGRHSTPNEPREPIFGPFDDEVYTVQGGKQKVKTRVSFSSCPPSLMTTRELRFIITALLGATGQDGYHGRQFWSHNSTLLSGGPYCLAKPPPSSSYRDPHQSRSSRGQITGPVTCSTWRAAQLSKVGPRHKSHNLNARPVMPSCTNPVLLFLMLPSGRLESLACLCFSLSELQGSSSHVGRMWCTERINQADSTLHLVGDLSGSLPIGRHWPQRGTLARLRMRPQSARTEGVSASGASATMTLCNHSSLPSADCISGVVKSSCREAPLGVGRIRGIGEKAQLGTLTKGNPSHCLLHQVRTMVQNTKISWVSMHLLNNVVVKNFVSYNDKEI